MHSDRPNQGETDHEVQGYRSGSGNLLDSATVSIGAGRHVLHHMASIHAELF